MKLSKNKIILIAVVLLVVAVLAVWVVRGIQSAKEASDELLGIPSNMDLTLDAELAQVQQVIDTLHPLDDGVSEQVFEDPQVAAAFVPEGSKCSEVAIIGPLVYIDYQLDGNRYIVSYFQNGMVQKVAHVIGGSVVYTIDSEEQEIKVTLSGAVPAE